MARHGMARQGLACGLRLAACEVLWRAGSRRVGTGSEGRECWTRLGEDIRGGMRNEEDLWYVFGGGGGGGGGVREKRRYSFVVKNFRASREQRSKVRSNC